MSESKAARGLLRALVVGGSLPPLPPGLSAGEVVRTARFQGLAGLLLKAGEGQPSSWVAPLAPGLVADRRSALVRTLGQIALAGRVLGLLEAKGIRALPLKGALLAETVYDVESDRPMSDVDVLALERWPEAVAALEEAGLTEFARGDHARAFTDPASGVVVELHRSVSSCPGLFPLDADAVWERSRPGAGQLPRRPATEDLLVHLALHAAFQHGLVLSLVQWLDFRRVLEREDVDAERLLAVASASRATAPLAAALLAAEAVVAAPLAPGLRAALESNVPRGLTAWLAPRLEDPLSFVEPETPALGRVRWELLAGRRLELLWRTVVLPDDGGESISVRARAAVARAVRLGREQLSRPGRASPEGAGGPEVPFREELIRECLASFPWVRLTVTGQCMQPALAHGEKVHLVRPAEHRPRVGDVVLARGPDGLRLHRLVWGPPVAPPGTRWRTKADRGRLLDPPLDPSDLLGTVVTVEGRPGARSRRPVKAALLLAGGVIARLRMGASMAEASP
jgi:hypothetical protein